jgi:Domain of unknown function (DUF1707)
MRIGDTERDAAAADLGDHFTAGRLTLDELHERLEAVFAAKTFGQLARIMSDLPGPGRLPGLTRLARHPATPGMPARPWMPVAEPGYSWAGEWNAGMRGSAMGSARAGFQPGWQERPIPRSRARDAQYRSSPADRAGKFAALSLLILAMLIWLFTALLFARHGGPAVGPMIPPGR